MVVYNITSQDMNRPEELSPRRWPGSAPRRYPGGAGGCRCGLSAPLAIRSDSGYQGAFAAPPSIALSEGGPWATPGTCWTPIQVPAASTPLCWRPLSTRSATAPRPAPPTSTRTWASRTWPRWSGACGCLDCVDVCTATLGVTSRQADDDADVTKPLLRACMAICTQLRRRLRAACPALRALPGRWSAWRSASTARWRGDGSPGQPWPRCLEGNPPHHRARHRQLSVLMPGRPVWGPTTGLRC